jgi:hypothetical protein
MKKINFLILGMLFIWGACRKDTIDRSVSIENPTPVEYVKTTIGGVVVADFGAPIKDALVTIGSFTTKTNFDGVFQFIDIIANSKGAYIKVEHPAFFHGSKTIDVSPNTRNKVKFILMDNISQKFVNSTYGGKVDFIDYSITLPAKSFVSENKENYDGLVFVAAKWLNPTSLIFQTLAPGRLMGIRTDGTLSGMVSMGMLAVELKDDAGRKLQLKEGSEAIIRLKVPEELMPKAPVVIPLWYFNEETGIWVEEGDATLINGFYEGKVKHFSFWNCDYPTQMVQIKIKVLDQDGNAIQGTPVKLTSYNYGQSKVGYTDNFGIASGAIPKNEIFNAEVYSQLTQCYSSDTLSTQQIGPFTEDVELTFTVNIPPTTYKTIKGKLLNCNGEPIPDGYVKLNDSGGVDTIGINVNVFFTDNEGNFEFVLKTCNLLWSIDIIGYDLGNLQESNPINLNLNFGDIIDLGTILTCTGLQEYFTYTTPSGTYISVDCETTTLLPDTSQFPQTYIYSSSGGLIITIILTPGAINIGNYPVAEMYVGDNNAYIQQCLSGSCNGLSVNITEYNGTGEYISGNYSGNIFDNITNSEIPISGTFRGILQ